MIEFLLTKCFFQNLDTKLLNMSRITRDHFDLYCFHIHNQRRRFMQMVLFRKNTIRLLTVSLVFMTCILQATNLPIEIRRNNSTTVINGNGNPSGTGVLDDVRIGGIHHRGQRRNIQDLTVTGSTQLWGHTTVGRPDGQDHLKRADLVVYGDSVVSSQSDRCEQRREGWVKFDVHKDVLLIKFCPSAITEEQPNRSRLGAAWVELYYCGTACDEVLRDSSDVSRSGSSRQIVFLNRGIMVLPCKALQVGDCSTFDVGTFLTSTLPAHCGVVTNDMHFLKPCMTFDIGRNATALSLVPSIYDNDENNPLIMPRLGDSSNENDAVINAYSQADMLDFFSLNLEENPCSRYFGQDGSLFYRVVSCDVAEVKVVAKAKLNEVLPCPADNVCGDECCPNNQNSINITDDPQDGNYPPPHEVTIS